MRTTVMFALLISTLPAAAAAKPEPGSTPSSRKKMICVEDTVVGSRLATKRICKTKEEWKQERLDSRQFLEKATNSQTNPVG